MNLKHLNLDLYGVPDDTRIQISVFLISEDLKTRKLVNGLINIGCDSCFCVGELCDLVLAYMGFDDRPNNLYTFYFELLDRHCEKVSYENDRPIKEALLIYAELKCEWEKYIGNGVKTKRDTRKLLKGVGSKLHTLRKNQDKELDAVARVLRITPAVLIRIERGDYDMCPDLLSELCDYYDITLSDFFRDVEDNLTNGTTI
jgi:DNA-binding XRE family transcriptional regulator